MSNGTPPPAVHGPTVVEIARARIKSIDFQIKELAAERQMLQHRIKRFAGSQMGEAERAATAAEPFQTAPLDVAPPKTVGEVLVVGEIKCKDFKM